MIAGLARELGLRPERIPLWGERYPEPRLRLERAADPRSYDRGFRLLAFTPEETLFPSFAEKCVVYGETFSAEDRARSKAAIGMDIAGEGRLGTWLVGGWVTPEGVKVITHDSVRRGAWTATQALDALAELDAAINPRVIIVEDNATQAAYLDVAKANRGRYRFWSRMRGRTTTGTNKRDRSVGLPALEVQFGNAAWRVLFPERHRADCGCALCDLVREFTQYPLGEHDDAVMATWELEHGFARYCGRGSPRLEADEDRVAVLMEEQEARVRRLARGEA